MLRQILLASVAVCATLLAATWGSTIEAATPGLTTDTLRNITYPSQYTLSGSAPLRDGKYDQRADLGGDQGAKNPAVVTFTSAAIGDNYSAVLLATNTGGSGVFLTLHLVTVQAGVPQAGPGLFLGDRWRVNSMTIAGDRLTLDVTRPSATDPLCCPTFHDVRVYTVTANAWTLFASTPETGTTAPIPPNTGNAGLTASTTSPSLELALAMAVITLLTVTRLAPRSRASR